MVHGPRFLDEPEGEGQPVAPERAPSPASAEPDLPQGPLLLEPEPDAPSRLGATWEPDQIAAPRPEIGATIWIAIGIAVLLVTGALFSGIAFVLVLADRSRTLAGGAALAIVIGLGLIALGAAREWRSLRALQAVSALRIRFADREQPIESARQAALSWVRSVARRLPDPTAVEQALRSATTSAELMLVLRGRVQEPLRAAALQVGRRAAMEGGGMVAISPHASWDGLIFGLRGVLVIRQVAVLYGLRPGPAVTLALLRRVAWTAAGTAGLDLLSKTLADHALQKLPIVKHIADIVPGSGFAAMRLYRLAGIAAEACCPVLG